MRNKILIFFFFLSQWSFAQLPGIKTPNGAEGCEIPFEYVNHFIIIKVYINGFFPCNFIFDTGAEHTLITKKEISDILGIQYEKEFKVIGADLKTVMTAYLAKKVQYKLFNGIEAEQDVLVLADDYINLDDYTGMQIHGILGADAFLNGVVKIDYDQKKIQFIKSEYFNVKLKKYTKIPINISKSKPYINVESKISDTNTVNIKLLMDTGANLGILLYPNDSIGLSIPPKTINGSLGAGLGGQLFGVIGRINALNIGSYNFGSLPCTFQALDTLLVFNTSSRNGIIGNVILERFNLIIDYNKEQLYLSPNKNFKQPFLVDKSGLSLISSGVHHQTFIIQHVQPNSPASEVDIKKGDIILKVGWLSANFFSLDDLIAKFRGKNGKKIKLKLLRDGKKLKKTFYLRDLI